LFILQNNFKEKIAMTRDHWSFQGMSLFTYAGERKYLTTRERARFFEALSILGDPKDRTYVEMIYWTGCRVSEALALSAIQIDLEESMVIVRSLKKRGVWKGRKFRAIPVPPSFMKKLDKTHGIRRLQTLLAHEESERLWTFCRTTGWLRIRSVMEAAGLSGVKACGKGLRHSYGVHAATAAIPETRIQKWLGHESLETTSIYLDMAGPEDHAMAKRMWRC
jgi:integrase/recombinase XerD